MTSKDILFFDFDNLIFLVHTQKIKSVHATRFTTNLDFYGPLHCKNNEQLIL